MLNRATLRSQRSLVDLFRRASINISLLTERSTPPQSLFFQAGAYPKYVAIGMAQVKLTHVPGLVSRRHRYRQPLLHRELVSRIDRDRRFQPPAHPDTA